MKLIYILHYRDKNAARWFIEQAYASETKACEAKARAEVKDGNDFDYKITQVPF